MAVTGTAKVGKRLSLLLLLLLLITLRRYVRKPIGHAMRLPRGGAGRDGGLRVRMVGLLGLGLVLQLLVRGVLELLHPFLLLLLLGRRHGVGSVDGGEVRLRLEHGVVGRWPAVVRDRSCAATAWAHAGLEADGVGSGHDWEGCCADLADGNDR